MDDLGLVHFLLLPVAKEDRDGEPPIGDHASGSESKRYFVAERHAIPIDGNVDDWNSRLGVRYARPDVDRRWLLPDHGR